jgi:hypothetical protein
MQVASLGPPPATGRFHWPQTRSSPAHQWPTPTQLSAPAIISSKDSAVQYRTVQEPFPNSSRGPGQLVPRSSGHLCHKEQVTKMLVYKLD